VQHLGADSGGRGEERADRGPVGAENAMWDSRKPSPVARGPIQKSGIGGTP
jgi:hypothetical protein